MVSASKKIVAQLVGDTSVVANGHDAKHSDSQTDLFSGAVEPQETKSEPRSYGTLPQTVTYTDKWRRVRPYRGVREQRPDGLYANLVCPNGALHCIRVEAGDAVIIVRRDGEFVDMVVKGATDKASALQAAARKFLKLIERVR